MHECPECGQACDCDGEDTWFDDEQTALNCEHVCEDFDNDVEDEIDFNYEEFVKNFRKDNPPKIAS